MRRSIDHTESALTKLAVNAVFSTEDVPDE
jgi:hypothetical protein